MKFINKNLLFKVVVVLAFVGGGSYHAYTVGNLEEDLQETNETLKEQRIDSETQVKKKTEELNKLEKDHRDAEEELKGKNSELEKNKKTLEEQKKDIENKKKEIENLESELQAKLDTESSLASVQTEKDEDIQEDKSTVLSKENESKPEQYSNSQPENNDSNTEKTSIGTFNVTYYSVGDGMTPSTVTANGTDVSNTIYSPEGHNIIAVDTSVIPMNSIVEVTVNGNTFTAKASDTGSAINGNKIDILVSSPSEALNNGVQTAEIKIID